MGKRGGGLQGTLIWKFFGYLVIDYYQAGPPGGPPLSLTKLPIWDEKNGIYGYSTSAMSSSKSQDGASVDDILHLYHSRAESKRDPQAQVCVE